MTRWAQEMNDALQALVGEETVAGMGSRWKQHAARDRIEITLIGPYDSGKSSLLKRLLAEAEVPIPAWLTISARRETWETNEVDAFGVTFTDTPGFAAGDSEHERTTTETITLTDALLVVLPPQLLTGEKEALTPILDGRFFGPSRGWRYPTGALRIVIARLDEGGLDPTDDEAAFQNFVDGKRQELDRLLKSLGTGPLPASAVIADPYGLAGGDGAEYQRLGGVDGVASLIDEIKALAARKDTLRAAAQVRYLLHSGNQVLDIVDRHIGETVLHERELDRRVQDQALAADEIEGLIGAAGADLRAALADEAQSVAERPPTEDRLDEFLRGKLETRVAGWATRWNGQLNELAEHLQERYESSQDGPTAQLLEDLFILPEEDALAGESAADTVDVLRQVGPVLERGLREALTAKLGMTLEEAHGEVRRLSRLAPDARAGERAAGTTTLSEQDLRHLGPLIRGAMAAVKLGPIVLQVAAELVTILQEDAEIEAQTRRLDERRAALEDAANRIADEVFARWREGPNQLLDAARGAADFMDRSRSTLAEDLERRRLDRARLASLLEGAPPQAAA